ncbi:hypothetical protein TRV_04280 [Trichophyton verrucosum HKI 0517]|uniref:Uncharacterized protein n=1 Tax=Trichophyton verrucosum (strain HKI 0517) TaxID=663202 RepID=D4DAY2_TRIVH|nr:uncharacterized protein TRV_04280 [Trichophyton verrucosum HKI 0517]EFE40989.1 hypothetical protein TRV_04280 [Trichophyton verrucosum HKI 0517]
MYGVRMDICMYLAGREGKRYVRLHALSLTAPIAAAHRIASPFLDQGPPGFTLPDPSVLHGTHYGLALSHPATDSIEAKRSTTTALLSGASPIHQNPPPFQILSTLYWPLLIASSLHRVWQALLSYRLTRGTPSMRFRFVDLLGERRRRSKESRATGSFISYRPGVLECLHIYAYLLLPNDRRSKHPSPFPRLYIYFSTFVTIANPYNSFGSVFLVLFIISGA